MSGAGGLDVRYPIGGLFTLLGLVLAGYGFATASNATRYASSLGVNINLWWGLVMLVFGIVLLVTAARGRGDESVHPSGETPEGQATEAREHDLGLER